MFDGIATSYQILRSINVNVDTAWNDPELPPVERRVMGGDLEAGLSLLANTPDDHELRALRVHRLAGWMTRLRERHLTQLYLERPEDADVALWLGAYRVVRAWRVRTTAPAESVSAAQFDRFWFILGRTHEPLMRAATLRPTDPTPWNYLQWRAMGLDRPRAELDDLWQELRSRDENSYVGHHSRTRALCADWYGSNDDVLEFATGVADTTPPGEPLGAVLVAAHLEVMLTDGQHPTDYFATRSVRDDLTRRADDWVANLRPHVRTPEAHHLYGAALYLAGDHDRARRHLGELPANSVPDRLPWEPLFGYDWKLDYGPVRKALGLPNRGPVRQKRSRRTT
ncbi:hypothetical protein [Actinophytocola sediminis]